ncbi:helix-turn-helix transcriptional regulator [Microbacterium sp. LWH13-1.2]|uniref:helix-turn-helix domain-containing protein n=1 Tax=Microbacterium sp. LWH13-1.2 TaxID=3135260 RepID=UPI00313A039A
MIREAMRLRGMLQKDLAAATGMTQPQISVRLSKSGASIPVHQVLLMCAAVGLDATRVFGEASERAEKSPLKAQAGDVEAVAYKRPPSLDDTGQVEAVGRQIAASLWAGCDDRDFIELAIDQIMFRENNSFWSPRRKQLALMFALSDLAYTIGRRYPIRDQFTLKPVLDPERIIR